MKTKAKDLDTKFDAGEDITRYLELSMARRPWSRKPEASYCGGVVNLEDPRGARLPETDDQ